MLFRPATALTTTVAQTAKASSARLRVQALSDHLRPVAASSSSSSSTLGLVNSARSMSSTAPTSSGGGSGGGQKEQSPPPQPPPRFPVTDPSQHNQPLGQGKFVNSAACLVIGDEILSGKTKDSNSNYMAQWCFNLGIELCRIEVIADEEDQIVEAVRRLSSKYDLLVTSGGIGPTMDDITLPSIAAAFDTTLKHHPEILFRMGEHLKRRTFKQEQTAEMVEARKRMALVPISKSSDKQSDPTVEVLHVQEDLWVPVVRVAGKVHILPGVPRLFQNLLDGLVPYVPIDKNKPRPSRWLVHTTWPESNIAPFLLKFNDKCKAIGVKVGSYPKLFKGVDVSLIGHDESKLEELAKEVEQAIEGEIVARGKVGDERKE